MIKTIKRSFSLCALVAFNLALSAQTTNTYNSAATWTVPADVSSLLITVYGGGGGTGGRDCPGGCSYSAPGDVGYVQVNYAVTA